MQTTASRCGSILIFFKLVSVKTFNSAMIPRKLLAVEHPTMLHPTGMLVHKRMLYVLDQSMNGLLKFDAISTAYESTVLADLPDAPEAILLVPDC